MLPVMQIKHCIVVLFIRYVNEDCMTLKLNLGSFIQIWPLSGCIFLVGGQNNPMFGATLAMR